MASMASDGAALVYPMAAMVLLSATVLVALFRSRLSQVRQGQVKAGYFKIYRGEGGQGEADASVQLARHFANLFEAPVLFYAACLAAMAVGGATTAFQALAWAYVAIRAVHAFIHTGKNQLNPRIAAYFSSWLVLLSMWGLLVAGRLAAA